MIKIELPLIFEFDEYDIKMIIYLGHSLSGSNDFFPENVYDQTSHDKLEKLQLIIFDDVIQLTSLGEKVYELLKKEPKCLETFQAVEQLFQF
jgi:hypothetical protein